MTWSRGGFALWGLVGVAAVAIVCWPAHAYAWGPLAHIDFAQSALDDLGGVSQVVRILLQKCTSEYLYGALAADIVVGKNLSPYATHAHNWKVGFSVLQKARGDAERAFAYGYLAHLAVDTVAHNYFVPYHLATSFGHRRTGHAYWELRYDQRLETGLWQTARRVTRRGLRRHDFFLRDALVGASVLPFALSRRFFETLLVSARLKKWQRLSQLLARERDLVLADEEVAEMRALAVGQVRDLLRHGETASCTGADPTGLRNLKLAHDLRRRLEVAGKRGQAPAPDLIDAIRPAFRDAIHGPLRLPALDSLAPESA